MSALKMKFLQGKSGDKYNYPVTKSDGVFLDDQGNKTLKSFIDNDLKTLSWLPSKSIEGRHLKNASVSRDNIGTGAISETKITDEAVTNRKIQKYDANKSGSGIQTDRIADGAITDAKILPYRLKEGSTTGEYVGGISGDKIKNGAITREKIASDAFAPELIARSEKTSVWSANTTVPENEWADLSSDYHYLILGIATKENGVILATTFIPICPFLSLSGTVGEDNSPFENMTYGDRFEVMFADYQIDENGYVRSISGNGLKNYHGHLELREKEKEDGTIGLQYRIFQDRSKWSMTFLWGIK